MSLKHFVPPSLLYTDILHLSQHAPGLSIQCLPTDHMLSIIHNYCMLISLFFYEDDLQLRNVQLPVQVLIQSITTCIIKL